MAEDQQARSPFSFVSGTREPNKLPGTGVLFGLLVLMVCSIGAAMLIYPFHPLEIVLLSLSLLLMMLLAVLLQKSLRIRQSNVLELHDRAEHIRSLFERHTAVMYLVDPRTLEFVDVNPAAEQFYGYPRETLRTMKIYDINDEGAEKVRELIDRVMAEGRIEIYTRHRLADGDLRDVFIHATAVPDGGSGDLYFAIVEDATNRQRVLADLQRSQRDLLRAQRIARIGNWATDLKTNRLTWSRAVFDLVDWEPPQAEDGQTHFVVGDFIEVNRKTTHREDAPDLLAAHQRIVETGEPQFVEYRVIRRNGEVRNMRAEGEAIRDEAGRIVGTFGTCQDITEHKQHEQETQSLHRQIEHAQKLESLGVLAGGIAHDFNNLLVGILGNAELAMMELSPASPLRGSLQEIKDTAQRAADLTNQLLAYSGKGKFIVKALNLNELVTEMGHLLRVSISKKVILKYDLAEHLPSVEGDVAQLRQVVMNLITNASEAIGERSGIVTLRTSVLEAGEDYLRETYLDENLTAGFYVCLEIVDTGCGMDAETRSKLFDPFFTTKFTGRGLGLAAVLGIVRGHHGAIKLYSEVGRGTTFKILLPCSEQWAEEIGSNGPAGETDGWRGTGTLLVADDEEAVRNVCKMILQKHGFEVLTAADGREAVRLFGEHREAIRVVLLDMSMPHMSGQEAYREIRKIDGSAKVLLTSGYNEQEATSRFAGKGLTGFIQKPFEIAQLLGVLREALEEA